MGRAAASSCVLTLLLAVRGLAQDVPERAPGGVRDAAFATVKIIGGTAVQGSFHGRESGSGVIVSPRGLVVTNHHVISAPSGETYPELWAGLVEPGRDALPPNRAVRLKLLRSDPALDLAVLRLVPKAAPARFPYLRLAGAPQLGYGTPLTVVGFPVAGGATITAVPVAVVGLDDREDWIKVEGSLMRGVSGGAVVDARGQLVGIPTRVQTDQDVELLDDDNLPVGTVRLGSVGYLRASKAVLRFLAAGGADSGDELPVLAPAGLLLGGDVRDQQTKKPIPGVVVGVLTRDAPRGEIARRDLLAWARSGFDGTFSVSRALPAGVYQVKVVHPQYQSLVQEVALSADQARFSIELVKE